MSIKENNLICPLSNTSEELEIIDLVNNGIEIAFDEINTKLFIKKH